MANSTTNLDDLQVNQAGKEETVNALFDAMSPSALYGRREDTTMALTWGYYGGNVLIGDVTFPIANGTLTLTNNTTNYVEMSKTDGSVSVNTTGWTTGKQKLYSIVTASNLVTQYTDYRAFLKIAGSDSYTLPPATTSFLGGVTVDGTTITVDANGKISAVAASYTLPKASTTVLGGVKVDGTTITADANGVISATGTAYTLPKATTTVLGGVTVDGTTVTVDANGKISAVAGSSYTLPTASTTQLGGVKIDGSTININGSGVISANPPPIATSTVSGTVKIDGTSITINNGVISAAGSTTFTTNRVFDVTAVSGLTVSIAGGRACNTGGTGFYNSSTNIRNLSNYNISIPANSSGYIVFRNATGGTVMFVAAANLYTTAVYKPLYYVTSNASGIVTLEDVRNSFSNFNIFNPVNEFVQDSWAVSSIYSKSVTFTDLNTSGTSWNILPRRIMLQCTTAEHGFSVGHMTTIVANEPAVIVEQSNVRILTHATAPSILSKSSLGTIVSVTPANWKIVLVLEPIM